TALSLRSPMLRSARAQSKYPDRPIRLVIPFPPGGGYDAVGRPWAEKMKPVLGTVVVENQGGGGSSLGAASVARARPDGYTILLGGSSTHITEAILKSHPLYDPLKDLEPISNVAVSAFAIPWLGTGDGRYHQRTSSDGHPGRDGRVARIQSDRQAAHPRRDQSHPADCRAGDPDGGRSRTPRNGLAAVDWPVRSRRDTQGHHRANLPGNACGTRRRHLSANAHRIGVRTRHRVNARQIPPPDRDRHCPM